MLKGERIGYEKEMEHTNSWLSDAKLGGRCDTGCVKYSGNFTIDRL